MEDEVVLHHDLPEADQLARLVVLLMHRLQRPIDPACLCSLASVPVWDQDVQGLLNQSTDLVITLAQTFKASDQS